VGSVSKEEHRLRVF